MIAATIILGRALAPVEMLIGQWKSLVEVRAAWHRLEALLGSDAPAPATELPAPSGALALENVIFVAPGASRPILRGVSLQIAAGEVLALVGPSGSGKSTLARLVTGIVAPTSGSVRLDGAELSQWEPARLGRHLGYLPQEVSLLAGTVAENIARFGAATSEEILDAARRAHAHEMIVRLADGYDTPVGEAGQRLSGGQRQRVALARALCGGPRIVVLDEPNACLDAEGEQALAEALAGLRAAGATVLLITQRTPVLALADRIVVLRDGVIERIGLRQPAEAPAAPGVPVLQPARAGVAR
jgi:ABC-type protease/lipase transport system fused ATPase/permease subunit